MDTLQTLTHRLAAVPLLRELERPDLDAVAASARAWSLDADTVVARAGEPTEGMILVLEGELAVFDPALGTDLGPERLAPGDAYGEGSLLNELPHPATVRSVGQAHVLVLRRQDFQARLRERPEMAARLLDTLSRRLRGRDGAHVSLQDRASRDPLTGLLNRISFQERLAEECQRLARYDEPVSLILLDVDQFHAVNETLGPMAGDAILAWVGRLIGEHTRAADSAYRIGGEEFAVLCPSSEGDLTASAARRLVEVVGEGAPPVDFDVRVTVSAGYASAPDDARRPDTLFHAADRALLRAKAEGRNRACGPAPAF